jgi:hypothetical protein
MTDAPLNESERAELERLRAAQTRAPAAARPRHRGGRWAASAIALVLAALTVLASVVVVYARDELLDTDRYVASVAPLAEDPEIRAAVADRIATTINEQLELEQLIDDVVKALQDQGAPEVLDTLAAPLASAVEGFVADQVRTIVYSDRFEQLWITLNAIVHREVAALLQGTQSELLSLDGDMLYLDLGPIVDEVKTLLVDRGLTIAERLPDVSVQFPLIEVQGIANAQGLASLLETLAWALPLAAFVLLAIGVYAAPNRRRALLIGALLFAAAMVVLLAGVAVARTIALASLPETVRSPQAVAAVFDIVIRFLVAGAQTIMVLALIVALAAWLSGPGALASGLRRGGVRTLDAAGRGLARSGLPLQTAARFTARSRRAMRVAVLALALLWLVLWPRRGIEGVLWITATAVVAIAVIEILARTAAGPVDAVVPRV